MPYKAYVFVIDENNQYGVIETSQLEDQRPELEVLLLDGQQARVARDAITLQSNGTYSLPTSFTLISEDEGKAHIQADPFSDRIVIPVIAEEVVIDKQWVETGRVRVTKVVDQDETVINELLAQEHIDIQRIPMDQLVEAKPQIRYEGDVLIIPRVEEELVVEKRFRLKEEIRIVKQITEKPFHQSVTLQKEDIQIERVAGENSSADDPSNM